MKRVSGCFTIQQYDKALDATFIRLKKNEYSKNKYTGRVDS